MAIVDGQIRCSRCKEWKGLELFQPSIVKRGCGTCKSCKHVEKGERYRKNPEHHAAVSKAWRDRQSPEWKAAFRARNKPTGDQLKGYNLQRYGITLAEYQAMVKAQGGKCAICPREEKLFVDHCHTTGAVRGLLCLKCNSGIGLLGDTSQAVANALQYLIKQQPQRGNSQWLNA